MDKETRVINPKSPKVIKAKRPPKTIKEKKFVKEFVKNGGNATKAALKVYDTNNYNSAHVIACENLQKLTFVELMDKMGLTDKRLLGVLDDGLGANRVISAVNTDREASGATTDFVDVPDYAVRHKYLDTAFKLKDKYPKDINLTQNNTNNYSLSDEQLDRLIKR